MDILRGMRYIGCGPPLPGRFGPIGMKTEGAPCSWENG